MFITVCSMHYMKKHTEIKRVQHREPHNSKDFDVIDINPTGGKAL